MPVKIESGDRMKRILLAFNSQIIGQELRDRLTGLFEVVLCFDADETVELLPVFRPDVLVLDLMLSGMDSLSVLQAVRDTGLCSRIVAVTDYINEYGISLLQQMNVTHLMRISCDSSQFAGRILDIALWETEEQGLLRPIRNILAGLGLKLNTSGCRITEMAIALYAQNPRQALTTKLYPAVARACGGTPSQVEKAIRDCVESAWKNCNERIWRLYFATGKNGKVLKPSNGDFLARVAGCLQDNIIENQGEYRDKIG